MVPRYRRQDSAARLQKLERPICWRGSVHISSDRSDNREANLREADRSQNMRNRGATKRNSTGLKGVCWDAGKRKWLAQIKVDGRNKHLGRYDTPEEAHAAYIQAAMREHGEFARSK